MSNGRTTNTELFDLLLTLSERTSKIEGHLEHMARKEQLVELRQDVRNIEKALPTFQQAADRTDVTKGRELERDESGKETRSLWAISLSAVAVAITAITAFFKGT